MPIDQKPDQSLEAFRHRLFSDGVIQHEDARFVPLTGGVSSDIYRVEDGKQVFVVKRALPQLRVAATWLADIRRNAFEVAYLKRVRSIAPANVPDVHHHNSDEGYFTMELLGPEFRNWKTELLAGRGELSQARVAGELLGRIHRETWADESLRAEFETTQNFHELRLDPYLLATAERHPELRDIIVQEADRIRSSRQCLVHGDFSPKNLLFHDDRIMVLDCEVAWFGDAAFDVGFLLNHLTIKALHLPEQRDNYLQLAKAAWESYRVESGHPEIEVSLLRLLPMLMLARVDGKSPLEYLTEDSKERIRAFVAEAILDVSENLIDLWTRWRVFLGAHANR